MQGFYKDCSGVSPRAGVLLSPMATANLSSPTARRSNQGTRHLVNLLATAATKLIDAAVPTAMVLMIANLYGLEPLGEYCVAMAFASIATILCGNGLANGVCLEIAAASDDSESQNASLMAGTIAFSACFAAALPLHALAAWLAGHGPPLVWMVISLSFGYCLRAYGTIFNAALRGRHEMQVAVWPTLLTVLMVAVTVVPLLAMRWPLAHVAIAWSVAQVCMPAWLLFSLRRRGLATSLRGVGGRFGQLTRASSILTLESVVFRTGFQLAVVLLPLLITSREIGLYNAAVKPFQFLVLANDCVTQFFLPYLAAVPQGSRAKLEMRLQQFHKLAFFFTATTLVLVAVFASSIASLLFGEVGPTVSPFMVALAFGHIVYYSPPYASVFKSIGKSRLSIMCGTAQTMTMLTTLALLAPPFGAWGVVSASCFAYVICWIIAVWFYRESRLAPVAGVERYIAFLLFNLACGYLLEVSIGGVAAMAIFLGVAAVASLGLYWTGQERQFAMALAFPKIG